jgi:hypothetical protein
MRAWIIVYVHNSNLEIRIQRLHNVNDLFALRALWLGWKSKLDQILGSPQAADLAWEGRAYDI